MILISDRGYGHSRPRAWLHRRETNPRPRSKFQTDGRSGETIGSPPPYLEYEFWHEAREENARGSVGTGALKPSQNKARVSYVTEVGGTRRTWLPRCPRAAPRARIRPHRGRAPPPARTPVAAAGLLSRYPGSSTFFKRASEFRACSNGWIGGWIVYQSVNPQLIRAR